MLGREVIQAKQFLVVEIVADEVGLHVEHELPGEALCSRLDHFRCMCFGRVDLEHVGPVDLLHGEEGGGHAAAGRHELPAAEAELLGVLIGKLDDPPLDTLLRLALRRRKILTVGNDLCRYRCCRGGFFSSCNKAHFSVAKPTAHRGFLPKDGC